jgi:hypothetical protein
MRGESSMQFIEIARRLELHAFSVCTKAPKRYAPLLTNRIFELASTVHEEVRAANNIYPHNQHEAQMRQRTNQYFKSLYGFYPNKKGWETHVQDHQGK